MKKCLMIILCFISVSSFAQLSVGIKGSYQMVSLFDKGSNQQYYDLSNINTIAAGLSVEKNLGKYFSIQSGINYTQKGGFKRYTNLATSGSTTTLKVNYIEVPVNLVYKEKLNKSLQLILAAGLYGAAGISGTEKGYDLTLIGNTTIDRKVQFTNNSTYVNNQTSIKPLDFGYDLSAGIEWNKFQFTADFSRGFNSIFPVGSTNFANQTLGISVAYLMPWK